MTENWNNVFCQLVINLLGVFSVLGGGVIVKFSLCVCVCVCVKESTFFL